MPEAAPTLRLAVFLTAGMSLARWRELGMLDRELSLYRAFRALGVETTFVSYGSGAAENAEVRALRGEFRVLTNYARLPRHLYVKFLPLLHGRGLARTHLFKANQTDGSEVAHRCARFLHRPWVARSGYDWSDFLRRGLPAGAWEIGYAETVEAEAAAHAGAWIFSTALQRDRMTALHPALAPRAHLVPNHVDTALFAPSPAAHDYDLLAVGRLEPQKNTGLLLRAARLLPGVRLAVAGTGSEDSALKALAAELGVRVDWLGSVPHARLPGLMNRSRVYVLPSLYEGLPKTLIEALSCGMAVAATRAPGIREVLRDGETGLLAEPEPEALAAAIRSLLDDPDLSRRLGANARREAETVYSLSAIARREAALLRQVAGRTAA